MASKYAKKLNNFLTALKSIKIMIILSVSRLPMESWPPPYQIRVSQRAKHVHITVSRDKGIHVVVPPHNQEVDVVKLLSDNRKWIARQIQKYQVTEIKTLVRPSELNLLTLERIIQVEYMHANHRMKVIERPHVGITFIGEIEDERVFAYLRTWLKKKAYQYYESVLPGISALMQCPFRNLDVRGQKSLWGSCSAKGDISLNYKLLFLPKVLTRYVIIHELAHTQYLNHSESFWRLVEHYDANYQAHRKALNKAVHTIPAWL